MEASQCLWYWVAICTVFKSPFKIPVCRLESDATFWNKKHWSRAYFQLNILLCDIYSLWIENVLWV